MICLAEAGDWVAPTLVNGSTVGSAQPEVTQPPIVVSDLTSSQTAAAGSERPTWAWIACSGVAAKDVVDVDVASSIDKVSVPVNDDGFFLALVKAGWGERLNVSVLTQDGRRVAAQP